MAGVNTVTLIGHLGSEPELRFTQQGTAVLRLRLATNERVKRNNEWTDHAEWHSIVVWGEYAKSIAKHLNKGSQVYLTGKLRTRKWQDRDGNDRYSTEIVSDNVVFL